MLDILIKDITIIDGTGEPRYQGNIGILEGKIILPSKIVEARMVIEGSGYMIAPGFIDAHSHGDLILGDECAKLCKTSQGVTTEIGGQCGLSAAPISEQYLNLAQAQLSVGALSFPKEMKSWTSYKNYIEYEKSVDKTTNIVNYVGHSTLRIAVMGFDNREPTFDEMEQMKNLLREAMEEGAIGLSTGLIYTPCCYATSEEIVELVKVIKPYNGIYATHMRNESYDVVNAVKEAINIGREAQVPVFISHHKVLGKSNWGLQKQTLQLMEEARKEGISITIDQYPYTCCMTHLSACIPPWYFNEGVECMAEQLKNPVIRQQIKREMLDEKSVYDNYYLNAGGFQGVLVSSAPHMPQVEGKTIQEYADELEQDAFDTFFDILIENQGMASAVYSAMCEEDVFEIAQASHTVIGSDGLTRTLSEKGHPRAYATFPRAICYYHKEAGIMSLEEVIYRMTLLPAERLHLFNKGRIQQGYDADLVIFDYNELKDMATYLQPNTLAEGIEYVIVNGEIVYKKGKLTGVHSGKVIAYNH